MLAIGHCQWHLHRQLGLYSFFSKNHANPLYAERHLSIASRSETNRTTTMTVRQLRHDNNHIAFSPTFKSNVQTRSQNQLSDEPRDRHKNLYRKHAAQQTGGEDHVFVFWYRQQPHVAASNTSYTRQRKMDRNAAACRCCKRHQR